MRERAELVDRLDTLTARAEHVEPLASRLSELEDVLTVGYAGALAGEARMMKLEQELDDLLDTAHEDRARALRLIVREHRSLEHSVARLRTTLARLQTEFVALGGGTPRS
jgi:hypothetical protein